MSTRKKVSADTKRPRQKGKKIPQTLAQWCREQPEYDPAHTVPSTLWSGYEAIEFTADAAVLIQKLLTKDHILFAFDYVSPATKLAEYICLRLKRGISRDLNDAFEVARLIKRSDRDAQTDTDITPCLSLITMTIDEPRLLSWVRHTFPSIDTTTLEESLSEKT